MRAKYYEFSMRQLMGAYAKLLYEMSPGNKPFRADDVMAEAREAFQSHMIKSYWCDLLVIEKTDKGLYDFFREVLDDKPGFHLLNYTKVLMRTKFSDEELATKPLEEIYNVMKTVPNDGLRFSDMYTRPETTQEEWDNDFIDLDAFIQNFTYALEKMCESNDCFLCQYSKNGSVICTKCYVNEDFKNFYKSNVSYSKGHTVCSVGCPRGLKICCSDCKKDEKFGKLYADCPYACDDTPDTCKGWRFKDTVENPELIEKDKKEEAEAIAILKGEKHDEPVDICTERLVDECYDPVSVQPSDH
nr:MAG TPA: hypothetical protein [Caudoviricetes sp.]